MLCATEAFLPHTEIPPEAIVEFLNARAPPDVPTSHPRVNDASFIGENLRPFVERVDRHLIIKPADERLARKIDMERDLQEILDDLSKFNQEPPFPSCPDPLSLTELTKLADELFPGYNRLPDQDDGKNLFDSVELEPLAVFEAEHGAQWGAVQEWVDVWTGNPFFSLQLIPATAPGALWIAAPTPTVGWPTPLPDYASPATPSDEHEHDNEGSGAAKDKPPPFHKTPGPVQEAPLPDHDAQATDAPGNDQPAATVEPSTPATDAPRVATPNDICTLGNSSSSVGPSTSTSTPPPTQEAPLPEHDAQTSQARAIDSPAPAVKSSAPAIAVPRVATPTDTSCSNASPSIVPATPAPAQDALPEHETQPIQAGPSHQPATARKPRGRPPKVPAPQGGAMFINTFSSAGPSNFPAAVSSPAPARSLGNGSSVSMFQSTMREPKQFDPFAKKAPKAAGKPVKKSARK